MIKDNKIVYCPPPFEEVQNEATRMSDDGEKVLECSLHSDLSLLMRIDSLDRLSAQQYKTIKEQLQPMIDQSNYRQQFEDAFGKLSDDDLLQSCPSRYLQSQSEQKAYLEHLATKDKEARQAAAENAKKVAEKEKLEKENAEFDKALSRLFEV